MQTKEELDKFYEKPDPWEFQTHPEDQKRKDKILEVCKKYGPFKQALDIGCGEGWITKDLPAKKLFGYEVSENAKSRWPKKIKDFTNLKTNGECDLVLATGILYPQYDSDAFIEMILKYARDTVITCNIADWEVDLSKFNSYLEPVEVIKFQYREYIQVLRVFKVILV